MNGKHSRDLFFPGVECVHVCVVGGGFLLLHLRELKLVS